MARKNAYFESQGIATVGIIFDRFAFDFYSSARTVGLADIRAVEVPYAYTGLSVEAVAADVTLHIDEIIKALTTPLDGKNQNSGEILTEKITTQAGYQTGWGKVELGPVEDDLITFTGKTYDEAYESFQKKFLDWGWGDGFPLVPPTIERVHAMLSGTSHPPDEILTDTFHPGGGIATVEKIAIQAVMAGARPEHFPVILAATQCMIDAGERFIIAAQSTSPHTPFYWINGPIIKKIGINYGIGTLGPGAQSRVNIAIGRSSRLVMMNVGGAYLGVKDMDTIGCATKFGLVTAEDEDDLISLGWKPYHVTMGFKPTESTISMVTIEDRVNIVGMSTGSAEGLLLYFAACMGQKMNVEWQFGPGSSAIVLLSGDDAHMCVNQGWTTKDSIRNFLAKHIKVDREVFFTYFSNQAKEWGQEEDMLAKYPEGDIYAGSQAAEGITILRTGGFAGKDDFYRGGGRPIPVSIDKWR